MKRISVVGVLLGLMTFPAAAEVLSASGPGADPQQQQASEGHYGKASPGVPGHVMPEGARAFVANASYYGGGPRRFEPNTHTASGERFNQWGLTAAHRTLPLGTRLLVTHQGRSVVVRVNDRGPAAWTGRSLDLSRGAASRIGLISNGTGPVLVQVLNGG
jgi:rare lipoprotein A